jgi:hypothetical protein
MKTTKQLFSFCLSLNKVLELAENFDLALASFVVVERCQRALLVCAVHLVLLSQTHSLHTTMPTPHTHTHTHL